MRQKYVISQYSAKNNLKIQEYAVVDKNMDKVPSSRLKNQDFQYLCKETYENKIVVRAISKGMSSLVSILRTPNIFPIEPYATKIAESVISLYNSPEDVTNPVELFFDDVDLLPIAFEH